MAAPMTPAPFDAGTPRRTRRTLLRGLVGLSAAALIFSACSSTASSAAPASGAAGGSPAAGSNGSITFGSYESDAVPKAALASVMADCSAQTGVNVTINTTDHGKFQNAISSYLQGTPDDLITWFSGERLKFFAAKGLVTPIDDVWADIGAQYPDAFKGVSTGNDGKMYFVPYRTYPWPVMYLKSFFAAHNYTVPKTYDEFVTLAKKVQADGFIPLAFGDKDGWPAMGTFDILDLKMNGYQFHTDLMSGKNKWTDPKVIAVFQKWKDLIPFLSQGALGATWQEAAQQMVTGKAGMYFLGTFAAQQVPAANLSDLDFFPFPALGTAFDKENGLDTPIDGFMLPAKANPKNVAAAKSILKCLQSPAAVAKYVSQDTGYVGVRKDTDTSAYNAVQKKSSELIATSNGGAAQFLDRDARSDFAGPNGMQGLLQTFLKDPNQDLAAYVAKIQAVYDSLPAQ